MELITKNYNNPSMSEDITALAKDFLIAKKSFIKLGLNGRNEHQNYDYACLDDIYASVEGALSDNNIWIVHYNRPQDSGLEYIYTRLEHTITGQWLEDCRILQPDKPGNKERGAAETYMKKYAVLSVCGIAPHPKADIDAQDSPKVIEKKKYLTKDDVVDIVRELKSCSNAKTLHEGILSIYKVQNLDQMPYSSYDDVKLYIENNRK